MLDMENFRPFEVHEGDAKDLVGHQEMVCHIMFDVKLGENFRRNAKLVDDGHKTSAMPSACCASVVSRKYVRITLLDASLRGLDILSCDVQNAYLSAP